MIIENQPNYYYAVEHQLSTGKLDNQESNSNLATINLKGLIILPTAGGILADFWVPNEIDSLHFQHMLLF